MAKVVNRKTGTRHMFRCFALCCYLLMTLASSAQAKNKNLDRQVHVKAAQISADQLIRLLKAESGYEFSFNSKKIGSDKFIAGGAKRSVKEWLNLVAATFGVQYKAIGNHIILSDKTASKPVASRSPQKKTQITGPIATRSNVPVKSEEVQAPAAVHSKTGNEEKNVVAAVPAGFTSTATAETLPASTVTLPPPALPVRDTARPEAQLMSSAPPPSAIAFKDGERRNNIFLAAELHKTKGMSLVYNRQLFNSRLGLGVGVAFIDISTKKLGGIMPVADFRYFISRGASTLMPMAQVGYNFWNFTYTRTTGDSYQEKGGPSFSAGLGYSYATGSRGGGPFAALMYRSLQYRYSDPLLPARANRKELKISVGWRF